MTLGQMMKNKIEASIDRKNIRDCFDIEFLMRRGVGLGCTEEQKKKLQRIVAGFTDTDYSVTLGSLLEPKDREFYREQKFAYLKEKLAKS
jgi:hypothetical protein